MLGGRTEGNLPQWRTLRVGVQSRVARGPMHTRLQDAVANGLACGGIPSVSGRLAIQLYSCDTSRRHSMPTTPRHLHQRQEEGYCLISRLPRPLLNAPAADRPPLYVLPLLLRCAAFSTLHCHQRVTTLPLRKGQRPRIRSDTPRTDRRAGGRGG